jgi:ABC-2 type transport system permease protein
MSLQRLWTIVAHEIRLIRRDPIPVLVLVVFPLILMAFLKPAFRPLIADSGHPHANGAEQVVPGEATANAFFVVGLTAFAFFSEWGWATWDRLRASRATGLEVMLGKALPRVAMSIMQFVIVFAIGIPVFGLHIQGSIVAFVPLVVAFAVCLVALGVAVTAICKTVAQASAVSTVGLVVFGAVGGALVPFHVLPGWAQAIAPITPVYWAMRGFRSVILDGRSFGGVELPVAVLLAMAAAAASFAWARFRFDEPKLGWS